MACAVFRVYQNDQSVLRQGAMVWRDERKTDWRFYGFDGLIDSVLRVKPLKSAV